ncbi:hypothetical protein ACRPOS_007465 [Bartonella heixiaziensis]
MCVTIDFFVFVNVLETLFSEIAYAAKIELLAIKQCHLGIR